MQKKLIVVIAGISLIVAVFIITSLISSRSGGGYTLFQDAIAEEAAATCTFTNTEELSTGAVELIYVITAQSLKIEHMYNNSESSDGQATEGAERTSHTLITDGVMYSWEQGERSGNAAAISGVTSDYFSGNQPGSSTTQQEFSEAGGSCVSGVDDSKIRVPEGIDFIDESEIFEPVDRS